MFDTIVSLLRHSLTIFVSTALIFKEVVKKLDYVELPPDIR